MSNFYKEKRDFHHKQWETEMRKSLMITSRGLRDFLKRKNIQPTNDSEKDVDMAKKYLPLPLKTKQD